MRNGAMAEYADALVAIDQDTHGTNDMIKQANARGLKVFLYSDNESGYVF